MSTRNLVSRRAFALGSVGMAISLGGCVTIPGAPQGTKEETVYIDQRQRHGPPVKLEVILIIPPGTGPFDVVLYSHGGQTVENSRRIAPEYMQRVAPVFLKRNIALAFVNRQGRGGSGGEPANLSCNIGNSLFGFANDYSDVVVGLQFIQNNPLFRGKKVYAIGHSRGGYLSAALAANRPSEIAGAVAFGAGWMSVGRQSSCRNGQDLINEYFERLASPGASPTLFVYDESDSYHPPPSTREAFALYQAKGGTGQLKFYPPVSDGSRPGGWGEGHFFILSSSAWESDVMKFLGIQ